MTATWAAKMITAPAGFAAPVFTTTFELPVADIAGARLRSTAWGIYEATINARLVNDDVLAPGWTSYHHRLALQTSEVTALLQPGGNTLSVTVADGWWRGRLGFRPRRETYGPLLGVFAQLDVTLEDGREIVVGTDGSWRVGRGPVIAADLYDGETFDARDEIDASEAVEVADFDTSVLFDATAPPIRRIAALNPVSVDARGEGRWLVDVGQNMVGWLACSFRGLEAGDAVVLRHAEVLDENGALFTAPLRTAKATDTYIARGGEVETYEPRFTFHGFRYAEITGPSSLQLDGVQGVVIASALEETGAFECSNALVNRLHENVRWSWRGNSVGVPTDCPQRDERLGWTGDAQVFAPTAMFLTDAKAFFESWLSDLATDQHDDGGVPHVAPDILGSDYASAAGWGDAAVVVPWRLYEAYGDEAVLRNAWPSIVSWARYVRSRLDDDLAWSRDFQFGDWLDPDAPLDKPYRAKARFDLVATAYAAHTHALAARIAAVIARAPEARSLQDTADELRKAWWTRYGDAAMRTQTGCAMALQFELAPAEARSEVGDRLVELVRAAGNHLATGFLGTPLLCPALTATGHVDVAYDLLMQDTCPSWLHAVKEGATTIWERWDATRPDVDLSMVSFNHYAYGAVADWLHRTVAGLAPDPNEPGYKHVVVAPKPGGGLTWARASLKTRYGLTSVAWSLDAGTLTVDVVVPDGAHATVTLPGVEGADVGPGSYRFSGRAHSEMSG